MNCTDTEVIRIAVSWLDKGHRVTLGTVVQTWGSAPRPPGSLMIIRDDGQVSGSVSGGCIEDDLIGRVERGELALSHPESTIYGRTAEEAQRFGLPCGGTVQIVLEPLSVQSQVRELMREIERRNRVRRRMDMKTGRVRLEPARESDRVTFDGATLITVHGPGLRLLIIGGGQLSRYLASMATMLGYQITVCEPRTEYHEGWSEIPGVTLSALMPDDMVLAMNLDRNSAVVALTHDPKLDDMALVEALRTPAFYVGALGSRHNNTRRRERLLTLGVDATEVARLHGPVGLRLGGLTPPEIAVSIIAEMTARHRGVDLNQPLRQWQGTSTVCALS